MSDGPFACIKMRKAWRDLLEKADNHNFSPQELRRDLESCLNGDWSEDMTPSLTGKVRRIMEDAAQSTLFGNAGIPELEALRNEAAGSPLAELFLECSIQALRESHAGDEGLAEAASNTFDEWLARCFRGIEEHCINENVDRARSLNVRGRLNEAATGAASELAREVLGLSAPAEKQAPTKQRGLDDGVPINGER